MTRFFAPCAALAAALLLSACGTPYHPPVALETGAHFPGLADVLANSHDKTVDVLLIHGICSHDARWAARVVQQLALALGENGAPQDAAPAGAQVAAAADGQVQIIPAIIDSPAGRIRFDALIWSPLTQAGKRQLCYDHSEASAQCEGQPPLGAARARLNARGKDTLVDDCLPDAVIYEGAARNEMQLRMRAAILRVLGERETAADVPLVVIAHSMGSTFLFDTLLRMLQEDGGAPAARVAQRAVDRLRYLVMAANQIPLLSLADQPLPGGVGASAAGVSGAADTAAAQAQTRPANSLQRLLARRHPMPRQRGDNRQLILVGFNDPNDLLSYTLSPKKYTQEGVSVYNILVSNAPTWLGLLERPDQAHLDYLSNPDVDRMIVCGLPASAYCK